MLLEVARGQLDACEDELDAQDETAEVQGYGVEVLLRAGVLEGADEVRGGWGESDACEEGDYLEWCQ